MPKTQRKKLRKPKHYPNRTSVSLSRLTFHKLDWLEKLTIVLALWFAIYPEPYQFLLGVLLIIPFLGILINGLERPAWHRWWR